MIADEINLQVDSGSISDISKVILKAEKSGTAFESGKNRMIDAFASNGIDILARQHIEFYEISLMSGTNNVSFSGGKIRLVFSYPENTNRNDFDFRVLHLKEDGVIETIIPTLGDSSFTIDVESLSPFAIVYEAVQVDSENQQLANQQILNDSSDADKSGGTPKTSDDYNVVIYLGMAAFALLAIVMSMKKRTDKSLS